MIKKFLFLLLFTIAFVNINSQNSFISLKKVTVLGATDTVNNAPILIDINGNVVVSGNQKVSATQYDASTAQQLSNGVMTWSNSFNVSTQKAWVTANCTNSSGDIFVTGGVATGTTNGIDLFVVRYNAAGAAIWTYTYNGINSTTDGGTAIALDALGDVYVCGASDGTLTGLPDYVTIKINGSTGGQMWVNRYNYSNSIDVPTSIAIGGGISGAVIVSGSSGTTYTNWDFATVNYSKITGAQLSTTRTANPGGGQDKAFGATTDSLGNVYVTGTMWNGSNYDVQTQKIDTALNVVWTRTLDVSGYDDSGINIALDDSLNVYVTGSSYYNNTNRELIVVKYRNNGTYKWTVRKRPSGGTDAEGVRVKVVGTNENFCGGNFITNSNQDIAIMRYNKFGQQTLEKTYNGPLNNTDKLLDIVLMPDSNYIFASGRTYAGGTLDSNITLKYKYNDYPRNIINYNDAPARTENELLVLFQPSAVTASVINNTSIVHGVLREFLTPLAMTTLDSNFSSSVANLPCYKVVPWMTMDDSISTTRSGRTVKLMHHWTMLGVFLPAGFNDTLMKNYFSNSYKVVNYVDFNNVGPSIATPNDPEFTNGNSPSLKTNTYIPNADINIEPAWDISVGSSSISVGVFDTGINFTHTDFGNGTWLGSKIKQGYNYSGGQSLDMVNSNDPRGHGTAVAGIIGAKRNNNFAVSGVAGGNDSISNPGITLHDMKTAYTYTNYCGSSNKVNDLYDAILQGAYYGPNKFAQNIQNHSWTMQGFITMHLYDALATAFQLESVLSVASGNGDNPMYPCNVTSYPANYPDRWLMCVGANDSTGTKAIFSECGSNIDFIAPGTKNLYSSLSKSGNGVTDYMIYGDTCNDAISGTSFSAPHAAGVAGLMLSYIKSTPGTPNAIYPEDVEEIMELSAKDLTVSPSYTFGIGPMWDVTTGWGRIDAGKTLQNIKYPDYMVKHYNSIVNASLAVLQASNEITCLRANYMGMPGGLTYVDRYKVTTIVSHTLPSGYSFIKGWERDAESNVHGVNSGNVLNNCGSLFDFPTHMLPNAPDITANISATGATLTGYVYGIHNPNPPNQIIWFPQYFNGLSGLANFPYTLYLGKTTSIEEHSFNDQTIAVFPNPATDKVYIKSNKEEIKTLKVEVLNVLGQVVINQMTMQLSNDDYIETSNLKNGVYFFTLTNGGKKIVKKVIINH